MHEHSICSGNALFAHWSCYPSTFHHERVKCLLSHYTYMERIYSIVVAELCVHQSRRGEEQALKLALRQPWVWSVSDFVFLASAYEIWWPVLSLAISSSHRHCTVGVLIIAELARACRWSRTLDASFCPGRDLHPRPYGRQSSTLTTAHYMCISLNILQFQE